MLLSFSQLFTSNFIKMSNTYPTSEQEQQVEVEREVLQACRDTAISFRSGTKSRSNRSMLLSLVRARENQPLLHARLLDVLRADPSLAFCRFDSAAIDAPDGFTPLHMAAKLGNNLTMNVLLGCDGVSAWCRDLQGRTPLHLAVAHGKVDTCETLRKAMEKERHDPVGVNAPFDLTGNTPLGWAAKEMNSKHVPLFMPTLPETDLITPNTTPVRNAIRAVLSATPETTPPPARLALAPLANPTFLLGAGDRSILPRSPLVERGGGTAGGLSPLNGTFPPVPPTEAVAGAIDPNCLADALAAGCAISSGPSPPVVPASAPTSPPHVVVYGFGEASGWRPYMEDRIVHGCLGGFCATPGDAAAGLEDVYVFGILDGHGGDFTVNHVSKHLPLRLAAGYSQAGAEVAAPGLSSLMEQAFLAVDTELGGRERMKPQVRNGNISYLDESGSTGCVCIITREHVCCGNVGDSRAVLGVVCAPAHEEQDPMQTPSKHRPVEAGVGYPAHIRCRQFEARPLSTDHKPELPAERARIEAAGAGIHSTGGDEYRVFVDNPDGNTVAMSRAFGDFYFKQNGVLSQREQAVCALPEVTVTARSGFSGAFLVVACDGLWDVMSNQEAVDFVHNALLEEYAAPEYAAQYRTAWDPTLLPRVADGLIQVCVERNSKDNLSAVVVLLESPDQLLLN